MEISVLDRLMMQRCLDLAMRGRSAVAPNPEVGSVITYQGKIIGEGYHKRYKGLHAEIEAIHTVAAADLDYLTDSTIYVSLEPCSHYGHNPPCVDEIIRRQFKRVVIGNLDPNPLVNGQGITKLKDAGIKVTQGVLADEGMACLAPFFSRVIKKRPHIVLKWAQSHNGHLGIKHKTVAISNNLSKTLSHKWRTEVDAILVGIGTALTDAPLLTPRFYPGLAPLRVVLDPEGKLPIAHPLLDRTKPTIVFNQVGQSSQENNLVFVQIPASKSWLPEVLDHLMRNGVSSLLVEGGPATLRTFIRYELWDEIWQIISPNELSTGNLPIPEFNGKIIDKIHLGTDEIRRIKSLTR